MYVLPRRTTRSRWRLRCAKRGNEAVSTEQRRVDAPRAAQGAFDRGQDCGPAQRGLHARNACSKQQTNNASVACSHGSAAAGGARVFGDVHLRTADRNARRRVRGSAERCKKARVGGGSRAGRSTRTGTRWSRRTSTVESTQNTIHFLRQFFESRDRKCTTTSKRRARELTAKLIPLDGGAGDANLFAT